LVKSDDTLSGVPGPFDLVHSFLVFQHIPQARGEKIFARLIELLSDKGFLAVHFLCHRREPAVIRFLGSLRKRVPLLHGFVNLLYGKSFSEPLMEKNVYDLNRILLTLNDRGFGNVRLRLYGRDKLRGVMLFCQKKQEQSPYDAYDAC
jgi:hypothetical protein